VRVDESVLVSCPEQVLVGDREGVDVPALIVRVNDRVEEWASDAVIDRVA